MIVCLVGFAKPEPERLSNGKLVPTEATAYSNDKVESKKNGRGKLESIKKKKKKKGKDNKHNNK